MNYTIWVTTRCNMKCKYCYEGDKKSDTSLSQSVADNIIEYIQNDYNVHNDPELSIDFHGGEPFLNFEIMKYIADKITNLISKKYKVSFGTTTNATIINDDILNFIAFYMDDITVSLDGVKTIHDKFRPFLNNNGSYDIALENSMKILSINPNVRVRMTINTDMIDCLYEGVVNIAEHGFKYIVPVIDQFDRRWNNYFINQLEIQIVKLKKFFVSNEETNISICDPAFGKQKTECRGGEVSKCIYVDGVIYPCIMTCGNQEFCLGDVNLGIDSIKLSKLLSYNRQIYSECMDCSLKEICNGNRCKMLNRLITGKYILPSVMECEMNRLLYKLNGIKTEV